MNLHLESQRFIEIAHVRALIVHQFIKTDIGRVWARLQYWRILDCLSCYFQCMVIAMTFITIYNQTGRHLAQGYSQRSRA